MTTELCERILYILGGMLVGILLTILIDAKRVQTFFFKNGYSQAVQDILYDHIYRDENENWHQLSLTWRDLSK